MWVRAHTDAGAKPATIRRRLAALSSWYRYLATHDVIDYDPMAGVAAALG
jgi:site-specific recombinase XerD